MRHLFFYRKYYFFITICNFHFRPPYLLAPCTAGGCLPLKQTPTVPASNTYRLTTNDLARTK